jgi:hypothetical protein
MKIRETFGLELGEASRIELTSFDGISIKHPTLRIKDPEAYSERREPPVGAPGHLEIVVADPMRLAKRLIRTSGLFGSITDIGRYS